VCEGRRINGIGMHCNESRLEATRCLGVCELARDDGATLAL